MKIENSTLLDLTKIFSLYEIAISYQKERYEVHWPKFDEKMIISEILESKQYKISINNTISCVWAIAFSDKQIWENLENNSSIYIHRIATNPDFRGQNFVKTIVSWAIEFAKQNYKTHIRMDTVGENKKLIEHYTNCGFEFIGLSKLKNTKNLPAHYHEATVSLFEIKL
jgi:RimJ/RimL family protein N-acetyltransferase